MRDRAAGNWTRRRLLWTLPGLCATAASPSAAAGVLPASRSILSNGLTLLCRENHSTEIVSLVCLIRAGLYDEPERLAGLAAVTGEAVIRGASTRPGKSFDEALVLAGGNLSSEPGQDFTQVRVVCTRPQWNAALKLIGAVLAHPRLSDEDIESARQAVLARSQALSQDWTAASYQGLSAALYPGTPYGRPLHGYAGTLASIKPDDVRAFWRDNYIQNRMWVGMVGDFTAREALDAAQKQFVEIPFRPAAPAQPKRVEAPGRPRLEIVERESPGPVLAQLMVGFLAPAATRAAYPVAAVLDTIVGGGKRSRLWTRIREARSTGYELGSFYQPLQYQSHLVAYVMTPYLRRDARTGAVEGIDLDPIKTALVTQFRDLAQQPPTAAEMARARAFFLGRYARQQERTSDQARNLAWCEAMRLGADFDRALPELLAAVTPAQVQALAAQVIQSQAMVVTLPAAPELSAR